MTATEYLLLRSSLHQLFTLDCWKTKVFIVCPKTQGSKCNLAIDFASYNTLLSCICVFTLFSPESFSIQNHFNKTLKMINLLKKCPLDSPRDPLLSNRFGCFRAYFGSFRNFPSNSGNSRSWRMKTYSYSTA